MSVCSEWSGITKPESVQLSSFSPTVGTLVTTTTADDVTVVDVVATVFPLVSPKQLIRPPLPTTTTESSDDVFDWWRVDSTSMEANDGVTVERIEDTTLLTVEEDGVVGMVLAVCSTVVGRRARRNPPGVPFSSVASVCAVRAGVPVTGVELAALAPFESGLAVSAASVAPLRPLAWEPTTTTGSTRRPPPGQLAASVVNAGMVRSVDPLDRLALITDDDPPPPPPLLATTSSLDTISNATACEDSASD